MLERRWKSLLEESETLQSRHRKLSELYQSHPQKQTQHEDRGACVYVGLVPGGRGGKCCVRVSKTRRGKARVGHIAGADEAV